MARRSNVSIKVDVKGFCEGMDMDLKKLQALMPKTMARIGASMENYAKAKVRVDTGHLQRSITHMEYNDSLRFHTYVGTAVHYGPYQEYGTGDRGSNEYNGHIEPSVTFTAGWPGMTGQPYLRPALYDMEAYHVSLVRQCFREAVR